MTTQRDDATPAAVSAGQAQVAAIDATSAGDAAAGTASGEGPGGAGDPTSGAIRRLVTSPVVVTFLFLMMMMLAFTVAAPGMFGTTSNILQLAQNVAILTVVSVGTTFVIATAGIDRMSSRLRPKQESDFFSESGSGT